MNESKKKKLLSDLANRIKELRLEKDITQQDAYNDTSIHFGRIEQGKRDVNYTTLIRISEYFKVPIEDLFSS